MKKLLLALSATFMLTTSFHSSHEIKENKFNIIKATTTNTSISTTEVSKKNSTTTEDLYNGINFDSGNKLNIDVFSKAYLGFENLKKAVKLDANAHLLSICDFSLSSNTKRLWVIDVNEKKVLFNSLVAHGKNTGEEFATDFSNRESSYQSSLGFYITDVTYNGDNGYSLRLLGMDKGYNDAALQRAIVMHGADYVSEDFAATHKRIGRSWGCPAVPRALAAPIINTIKGKNALFIYYPDQKYLSSSEWLKETTNS